MAEYQHKNGSFSLFKNSYKQDGDNKPDYKGRGKDLAGNDIEIACWLRDGKDGGPRWLSCQMAPPREKQQPSQQPATTPAQDALRETEQPEPQPDPERSSAHFSNMRDDIPFAPIPKGFTC